jgi:hypothetical protein
VRVAALGLQDDLRPRDRHRCVAERAAADDDDDEFR